MSLWHFEEPTELCLWAWHVVVGFVCVKSEQEGALPQLRPEAVSVVHYYGQFAAVADGLTGMLDSSPSEPKRSGVGEGAKNAGPALSVPWPPRRRRRNSLWRRCSSFIRLLSCACSSENDECLDKKKKFQSCPKTRYCDTKKYLFITMMWWFHSWLKGWRCDAWAHSSTTCTSCHCFIIKVHSSVSS